MRLNRTGDSDRSFRDGYAEISDELTATYLAGVIAPGSHSPRRGCREKNSHIVAVASISSLGLPVRRLSFIL